MKISLLEEINEIRKVQGNEINCGDANPKGNIALTYKGGCGKNGLKTEMYRCTGCDGWFHKDCLIEHFKQEKLHDWGRKAEREKIKKDLLKIADKGELEQLRLEVENYFKN